MKKRKIFGLICTVICICAFLGGTVIDSSESPKYIEKYCADYCNGSFGDSLLGDSRLIYDTLVKTYINESDGLSNGYTAEAVIQLEPWKYSYLCTDSKDPYSGDSYLELKNKVQNLASYAYWAFVSDYPEAFWAGDLFIVFKSWLSDENPDKRYIGKIEIAPKEQSDGYSDLVDEYNASVISAIESIDQCLGDNYTDYAVLKAIHDYICDNSRYNTTATAYPNSQKYKSAHSSGGFFLRESRNAAIVCDGYASTFKVLCDHYDIPCVMVAGLGNKDIHMWNYVELEGKWYAVDVTWDDSSYTDKYFLVGSETLTVKDVPFSDNHTPEGTHFTDNSEVSFTYPELSESAFFLSNE